MTIPSAAQTPTQQGCPWLWLSVAVRMTWADGTDKVVGMGQNYHNLKFSYGWCLSSEKCQAFCAFNGTSTTWPYPNAHGEIPFLDPYTSIFHSSITTFWWINDPIFRPKGGWFVFFQQLLGALYPQIDYPLVLVVNLSLITIWWLFYWYPRVCGHCCKNTRPVVRWLRSAWGDWSRHVIYHNTRCCPKIGICLDLPFLKFLIAIWSINFLVPMVVGKAVGGSKSNRQCFQLEFPHFFSVHIWHSFLLRGGYGV